MDSKKNLRLDIVPDAFRVLEKWIKMDSRWVPIGLNKMGSGFICMDSKRKMGSRLDFVLICFDKTAWKGCSKSRAAVKGIPNKFHMGSTWVPHGFHLHVKGLAPGPPPPPPPFARHPPKPS